MSTIPARGVMQQVAEAIPTECRSEIIIVGSLAAALPLFWERQRRDVHERRRWNAFTNARAIRNGRIIAERLFAAGWTLRKDPRWGKPGDPSTPTDQLPILRLNPPGNTEWFLELAAAPSGSDRAAKTFERLTTNEGDFTLYSFRFLALTEDDPLTTEFGILYARPEMMALANLLHHPRIAPETIEKTTDKRSNKDLGRVLALAWLSLNRDPDALDGWPERWQRALQKRFPDEWRVLALHAGDGLRELIDERHKLDLDQATRISNLSLLRGRDLGPEQLRATARRVLGALGRLEKSAKTATLSS